jgi:hypothetical protein
VPTQTEHCDTHEHDSPRALQDTVAVCSVCLHGPVHAIYRDFLLIDHSRYNKLITEQLFLYGQHVHNRYASVVQYRASWIWYLKQRNRKSTMDIDRPSMANR